MAWSEKVDLGNGDYGKSNISETKTEVIIGSNVDGHGNKEHCHVYANDKTGDVGVVHRGHCGDCKDSDSSGK